MRKIIVIVQFILIMLCLAYGYMQRQQAQKFQEIAIANEQKAVEHAARAETAQRLAEQQMMMAQQALEASHKAMEECQKKKK